MSVSPILVSDRIKQVLCAALHELRGLDLVCWCAPDLSNCALQPALPDSGATMAGAMTLVPCGRRSTNGSLRDSPDVSDAKTLIDELQSFWQRLQSRTMHCH